MPNSPLGQMDDSREHGLGMQGLLHAQVSLDVAVQLRVGMAEASQKHCAGGTAHFAKQHSKISGWSAAS